MSVVDDLLTTRCQLWCLWLDLSWWASIESTSIQGTIWLRDEFTCTGFTSGSNPSLSLEEWVGLSGKLLPLSVLELSETFRLVKVGLLLIYGCLILIRVLISKRHQFLVHNSQADRNYFGCLGSFITFIPHGICFLIQSLSIALECCVLLLLLDVLDSGVADYLILQWWLVRLTTLKRVVLLTLPPLIIQLLYLLVFILQLIFPHQICFSRSD